MYMQKLFDVRNVILVTIASIAILQFGVFSLLGLAVYGLLLVYNLFSIIYNLREKKIYVNIVFLLGISYCIYFLVSSVVNGNIADVGSTILQYLLIFVVASFIRDNNDIFSDMISLSKVLTIATLAMAVLSVLLSFAGMLFPSFFANLPSWAPFDEIRKRLCHIPQERLIGFVGNPITTAYYCYTGLLFSIYLCSVECSKKWKILSYLNIVISSITIIFLTRCRTYTVALFAFVFLYISIYYLWISKDNKLKKRNFKIIIIASVALLVILIAIFIVSDPFRDFILNDVIRIQNLNTLSNRTEIFRNALIEGEGHRIFGINARNFEKNIASHTHNMYLEVLTFGGVPAFILFLLYLFSAIAISFINLKSCNKNIQVISCFGFAFICGYMVGGISEPGTVKYMGLIFPVMQVLIAFTSILYHNIMHGKVAKEISNESK